MLTIALPADLERRVREFPDPSEFVAKAVRKALEDSPDEVELPRAVESKWAKIVRRVKEDPVHLDGYSEQLNKDIGEFRASFRFNDDHQG